MRVALAPKPAGTGRSCEEGEEPGLSKAGANQLEGCVPRGRPGAWSLGVAFFFF